MVQVDVFWAYGIGAGMATAASYRIKQDPADKGPLLTTVVYCGLLFAPSGIWLLWGFPDWETMQVASSHSSLPPWLVALFAATNISQGMLGYWVARRLILSGRTYAAFLQAGLGYFGMFFILVHGWDGRGYQRFFSASRDVFATWPANPTVADGFSRAGDWLTSPVALTLYGMGAVLIPAMIAPMLTWIRAGHREAGVQRSAVLLVGLVFVAILGVTLGAAIVASVLIHQLGWWLGVPAVALLMWLLIVRRRNGLAYLVFRPLMLPAHV
ncbi:MAG TPA: hypothetical protein DGG94_00885 [Micromonosporaceae bacterium]|nr:hypothetical protein [Micromonosporaceae bacterium]HCU48386.1 hypothetical protein [Micromonosporaceae bacterium]